MTRASRPLASTRIASPRRVLGADADVGRALDVDVDAGQAQAALLHRLLVAPGPFEHGIDERVDGAVVLDAVDEDAVQDADLGGGQPDPQRVVHEGAHARDLLAQALVEDLDRQRLGLQHRIAVDAHVRERRVAPRGDLRIERRRLGLVGLGVLRDLDVVLCQVLLCHVPWRVATEGRRQR